MDAARKLYWSGRADELDRDMSAKVVSINARAEAVKVLDGHHQAAVILARAEAAKAEREAMRSAAGAICAYAVDLYRLGAFEQSERAILRKSPTMRTVKGVAIPAKPRYGVERRIKRATVEPVAGKWEQHPVTGYRMFVREGVDVRDVIPFGRDEKALAAVRTEWSRHGRIGAANLLVSLAREGLADDAKSYRKGMQSRRAESCEGAVRYSYGPGSIDVAKVLEAVEVRDDGSTRAIALR